MTITTEIKRFQDLSKLAPQTKPSSYQINIQKALHEDFVTIVWGCYDVGNYPRYYTTECKLEDLEQHMKTEIDKMYEVVMKELNSV